MVTIDLMKWNRCHFWLNLALALYYLNKYTSEVNWKWKGANQTNVSARFNTFVLYYLKACKTFKRHPSFPVSDAYTEQETNPVWYIFIYSNYKNYKYIYNETVTFKALQSKKKVKINQTLIQALMKTGENHQGTLGIWPMKMIFAIFNLTTYIWSIYITVTYFRYWQYY